MENIVFYVQLSAFLLSLIILFTTRLIIKSTLIEGRKAIEDLKKKD